MHMNKYLKNTSVVVAVLNQIIVLVVSLSLYIGDIELNILNVDCRF